MTFTLCDHLVQVGGRDVGGVVAVAAVRLGKAVHVQQLPVGHLAVGVEHLLAFVNGADAHHFEAVLRQGRAREGRTEGGRGGKGRERERERSFTLPSVAPRDRPAGESVGLTGVNSRLAL